MTEQERQESSLYKIDGPTYQDGVWTANITLKEQQSQILHGETKEEVQELMLHFLGQQALEIEKARILLRKTFESQVETEKQREQ
jgi:hypothetical protein